MSRYINNNLPRVMGEHREKITSLARGTGISRATLTKLYYNKGDRISYEVLWKLCNYFHCGVGDLLEAVTEDHANAEY